MKLQKLSNIIYTNGQNLIAFKNFLAPGKNKILRWWTSSTWHICSNILASDPKKSLRLFELFWVPSFWLQVQIQGLIISILMLKKSYGCVSHKACVIF